MCSIFNIGIYALKLYPTIAIFSINFMYNKILQKFKIALKKRIGSHYSQLPTIHFTTHLAFSKTLSTNLAFIISLYAISFPRPYPAIIFLPYPDALSLPFSLPASPLWKFSPLNVLPLSLTFHCSVHYQSYYNCFLQAPPPLQVVYILTAYLTAPLPF